MSQHEKINYVEFPARDLTVAKRFFKEVFDWSFTDFGDEYTAFSDAGLKGGFFKADVCSSSDQGAALIVFYSPELERTLANIEKAGGVVVKPIFAFPGGRRFHFTDPNGNEFAVWSE